MISWRMTIIYLLYIAIYDQTFTLQYSYPIQMCLYCFINTERLATILETVVYLRNAMLEHCTVVPNVHYSIQLLSYDQEFNCCWGFLRMYACKAVRVRVIAGVSSSLPQRCRRMSFSDYTPPNVQTFPTSSKCSTVK